MKKLLYPRLSFSFALMCCFIITLSMSVQLVLPSGSSALPKNNEVTFNFVDVDLPVVTKFISDITGKNFIFDEKVKGKITIIAPSKLSIDDAYNLFASLLELKGFTLIPAGVNTYKIIPAVEAKQRGVQISTEGVPINENYIARLLALKYISADEALKFFQPLISKDGHISTFGPGNMLLVVDSGLNIEKILSILELIDKPSVTEVPEVIPLHHASADVIARVLNSGFGRDRGKSVPNQPVAETATAVPDQRLNAVILFGDKGTRESMKALISLIDVPSPEAQGRINVYFLENADATDLAKVIEGILKGAQPQRQAAAGTPQQATPFEEASGITVTADKASNALIIVASPTDYQNLFSIIKNLDKRRRQVYVEAMIIEVSVDKIRTLGVNWRAAATKNGNPVAIAGFGTVDQTAIQNILQGLSGATVGGLGNFLNVPFTTVGSDGTVSTSVLSVPGYAALFNLSDFKDTVNVLSTPAILTSDNKEAEILVGENVPFISQSQTSVNTAVTTSGTTIPGVLNSITRQDVGIILKITPQITEGDHVKLDIYEEISSVLAQDDQITISLGPTITKRSTKTSVVVKNNQTVVIGGLIQDNDEHTVTKVPVLGDIPLLGWLFKTKTVTKNKTNLIVFLSPHVIKDPETAAEITKDKLKEFATSSQQYKEGELVVKFKESVPPEKVSSFITKEGAMVLGFNEKTHVYQLRLKKGQSVEDAIEAFSALPEIQYAEPNFTIKIK
jgi:general secretion pathway protein D